MNHRPLTAVQIKRRSAILDYLREHSTGEFTSRDLRDVLDTQHITTSTDTIDRDLSAMERAGSVRFRLVLISGPYATSCWRAT